MLLGKSRLLSYRDRESRSICYFIRNFRVHARVDAINVHVHKEKNNAQVRSDQKSGVGLGGGDERRYQKEKICTCKLLM